MSNVRAIPEGFHSLTPTLVCKGAAKAIEFYQQVFQAKVISRMDGPGGMVMHSDITIGDSHLMLSDEFPGVSAPSPTSPSGSSLFVYTETVDELFKRAVQAGCQVEMPLADQFWGDRFGKIRDPFGHSWGLAQHIEDVAPEEMKKRADAWTAQMSKSAGQA